jgi:DNA-binding PadR family transcriptional regulator
MNSPLYKGSLQTIILHLIEENVEMYGYQICQNVKAITNGELAITEGALYPTLHKLENKGIIESYLKKVDGRIRKYYKLTEQGLAETDERQETLQVYLSVMELFLTKKSKLI